MSGPDKVGPKDCTNHLSLVSEREKHEPAITILFRDYQHLVKENQRQKEALDAIERTLKANRKR